MARTKSSVDQVAAILERALDSAQRSRRVARETHELRRALASISIVSDEGYYVRVVVEWLAQLKRDSGLQFYETIHDSTARGDRLTRALKYAAEQYAATPEAERVYNPEAAIKGLVQYVLISIAIGSRMQDAAIVMSLPAVLEPFAALSPLIHAIWQNALATREALCDSQPERARARWLEVAAGLAKISAAELVYVDAVRNAVAYGIGLIEARLGLMASEQRAQALDKDPLQQVNAMSLRKIARLHQGDFDGAERFRKKAELLALHANVRQMFTSTLSAELIAHAMAGDLTGIKRAADAIEPLAARFPGWLPYQHLATGYFAQTRGQLEAALEAFDRGLELSAPDPQDPLRSLGAWLRLEAACVEVLVNLDRAEQAKSRGERALVLCAERGIDGAAFVVRRALALAEGRLGSYALASERLEAVIDELTTSGVTGLELGATYEARARIAIWAGDRGAIEEYGKRTAQEYRHGERSPLGARYERLMDEARSAGVHVLPQLTEFQSQLTTGLHSTQRSAVSLVTQEMSLANTPEERALCGLRLLCDARSVRSGHMYLYAENGLQLVASLGNRLPDRGLHEFVSQYLTHQLDTADCPTVIATESVPQITTSCWFDPDGVALRPVLLIAAVDGARLCAGAVMIEIGERSVIETSSLQLVSAVTAYLIRSGNAEMARHSDRP